QPAPSFSIVTTAEVRNSSGLCPDPPSPKASAMLKQPAWAAPINSSGLVPLYSPERIPAEYGALESVPLCVVSVPLPSGPPPFQTASAVRLIVGILDSLLERKIALKTCPWPQASIPA